MPRRRFSLTVEQVAELQAAHRASKHPLESVRFQAVRLYGQGYSLRTIISMTKCTNSSLVDWCFAYKRSGISGLYDHRCGGNRAKLKPAQIAELGDQLQADPHSQQGWTVEELRQLIIDRYSITYRHDTSYYRVFRLCGFVYNRKQRRFILRPGETPDA